MGPKNANEATLEALLDAGMDIMRLNFSHGSYEWFESVINMLRDILKRKPGRACAIALDTKGPEIRTGLLAGGDDVVIEAGSEVVLSCDKADFDRGTAARLFVDYPELPKVLQPGMSVFVDDGLLNLEVTACGADTVTCKAANTAAIGSKKGINLPGAIVTLPAVSEKDKADLEFGARMGVDFVFASFIRKASQVQEVRDCLGPAGSDIQVISKIENQEGIDNFDSILDATDGVMVARGDLGIEIPAEQVFIRQKELVKKCNLAGKPVIVATQMLESMIKNPRPTRAEVSDVGNAVVDGADCVMLSGETAKGAYPVASVRYMNAVCLAAEAMVDASAFIAKVRGEDDARFGRGPGMAGAPERPRGLMPMKEAVALAAVSASIEHGVKLIIVISYTGATAKLVSKYKPKAHVVAVIHDPAAARRLLLYRGIGPLLVPTATELNLYGMLKTAIRESVAAGVVAEGDAVVAVHEDRNVPNLGTTSSAEPHVLMRMFTI